MRTTASRDTFAWRDAGLPREIAIVCGAKRKGRVIEMLVSTKGRYALRLMVCVAQAGAEGKVALREVSEREDISLKYLEQLARPLVQAGLLRSRPLSGRATCCARWKAPRPRWRALICKRGWPARERANALPCVSGPASTRSSSATSTASRLPIWPGNPACRPFLQSNAGMTRL